MSVFLATHFPFSNLQVDQNGIADLGTSPDEKKLFEVLSGVDRHHALCVIEGEPGSGKSHLIRWLSVKWKRDGAATDVPLLIARADGSLEGTLRRLNEALVEIGVNAGELQQHLAQLSEITPEARAQLFKTTLALSFGDDFFVSRREDADWCTSFKLRELFSSPGLQNRWKAPDRILRILSGRGSQSERRDSEIGAFVLSDIAELVDAMQHAGKPSPVHIRLKSQLRQELDGDLGELTNDSSSQRLLRALNLRLNAAVQRFLGIAPDDLKNAFRHVRRVLRKEGKRLVLFLEDITNFQGVDEAIFDVLIADAATVPDECDLVSVVGVTPGYLRDVIQGRGNYLQRFTHHIRLSHSTAAGSYGEVTALDAPESQVRFVSRYLNAVRLGVERIKKYGEQVPSACADCDEREECHAAFGHVDDVGLYPFTERFIVGNFALLEDPEHRQTVRTPRGLLQGLLAPALVQAPEIPEGLFPDARLKGAMLPHAGRVDSITDEKIAGLEASDVDKGRLRLFLSLWGVETRGVSSHEINSTVFDWLRLPHIATTSEVARPRPQPKESEKPGAPPKPSEIEVRRRQLAEWRANGHLQDETGWRSIVWPHLKRFSFSVPHVPAYARQRLLTEHTWGFARTGRLTEDYFVLESDEWVIKGLESLFDVRLCIKQKTPIPEFPIRAGQVGAFLARLQEKVSSHLDRRWSAVCKDPRPWDPALTGIQLLAVRQHLLDRVSVDGTFLECWTALMGATDGTPRAQRSALWKQVADRISQQIDLRQTTVSDLLRLPQGAEIRDNDPLDAAVGVRALRELARDYELSDSLPSTPKLQSSLSAIEEIGQVIHSIGCDLLDVPSDEWHAIRDVCERVIALLRVRSISSHLRRVDSAITAVTQLLPNVEPKQIGTWKSAVNQAAMAGLMDDDAADVAKLEDFVASAAGVDSAAESKVTLLRRCQEAPISELQLLGNVLGIGEDTIGVFVNHARAVSVGGEAEQGAVKKVTALGTKLAAVGTELM